MPFEIKKEQSKDKLVTMGQADKEIEYYLPPGATEPQPKPQETPLSESKPIVEPEPEEKPKPKRSKKTEE